MSTHIYLVIIEQQIHTQSVANKVMTMMKIIYRQISIEKIVQTFDSDVQLIRYILFAFRPPGTHIDSKSSHNLLHSRDL